MLLYNIDFELTGILLNIIMLVFVNLQYTETKSIQSYKRLLIWNTSAACLDALTVVFYTYPQAIPAALNYAINSLCFICGAGAGYATLDFVAVYVERSELSERIRKVRRAGFIGVLAYSALFIANGIRPFIFTFDEGGNYQRIGLYPIVFIVPGIYIVGTIVYMFIKRHLLTTKQMVCVTMFLCGTVIGMTLQVTVFPNVFLSYFCTSLSLLCMLFLLETPDYVRLVKTMKQLAEAKQEAEDMERAESQFLANMSHELRTPINAVLGLNELMLRETKDPHVTEYSYKIRNSGKMLLETINEVLDFSRIRSGRMELTPVEYQTADMLDSVTSMIRERAEAKHLKFIMDVDGSIPRSLKGDDVRLRQVMTNLLTNAVKYTPHGSVTLTVGGRRDGDSFALSISVRDTGIGIKEEDMERLFSEFVRLDEERNRSIEGSGLGMNITTRLLELMGTKLEVESVYGEGSTFSFTVRQSVADPEPMGDISKRVGENAKTYTSVACFMAPEASVLITDDNETNLVVIRGLLKRTGVRVKTVMSGEETIETLRREKFEILLLDSRMPIMDGTQTLQKLRESHLADDMPVIALTADAVYGARESYLAAGFTDYLSKPVNFTELEKTLAKYIPKRLQLSDEQIAALQQKEKEQAEAIAAVEERTAGAGFGTAADREKKGIVTASTMTHSAEKSVSPQTTPVKSKTILVIAPSTESLRECKTILAPIFNGVYVKSEEEAEKYLEKHEVDYVMRTGR